MSHFRYSRGFTLLELILVMLILCLTLGLSGPSLKGFFAMRKLEDTGAKIVSLMEYARTQAICEGRVYRFYIDLRGRTYWLSILEKDEYVDLGTEWGRDFMIPEEFGVEIRDLLLDGLDNYVEFTGTGRMRPGSIVITDTKGEKVNIVCRSAAERFVVIDDEDMKDYEVDRKNSVLSK
ncbi:MAG: prepilin-type N-terminal cleavage/methylation domain-containing protein [Phycisphaerae bacterium]|nr:prepilin-type N-terminal cleavage/methylation domain-containing protein [Phycisphaerae bacterium]